jgi:hypothetical protein
VDQIRQLIGRTSEDLRLMLNAKALVWADELPRDQPNALSPDERFRVSLLMAEPEEIGCR